MKKIKICTFAILFIMSMTVLAACGRKDSGTNQSTSPSSSSSGTGQGSESSAGGSGTNSGTDSTNGNTGNAGTQESGSGNGASQGSGSEEESSTGVIGGMMDDVEEGMDDMLSGSKGSTETDESK